VKENEDIFQGSRSGKKTEKVKRAGKNVGPQKELSTTLKGN